MRNGKPETTDEAIWAIYSEVQSLTTTVRGTPGTRETGLVGAIEEVKDLTIETKDRTIENQNRIAIIEGRCFAFHSEGVSHVPPGDQTGLSTVPKNKIVKFLSTLSVIISLVIYNVGLWLGWWDAPAPPG